MTRELETVGAPDLDQAVAAAPELLNKHAEQAGEYGLEIWLHPPARRAGGSPRRHVSRRARSASVIIVHVRLPTAEITPPESDSKRQPLPGPEAKPRNPDHVSHPGWNALVALARLLARRTAQQHMSQGD